MEIRLNVNVYKFIASITSINVQKLPNLLK
jgi:hypothetical protein